MPRPTEISVTTTLMCITNFMGFFLVNWHYAHAKGVFFIYSVFILIGYLVLYFFWHGENWARWLVMAASLLCLWNVWQLRRPFPASSTRVPLFHPQLRVAMVLLEAVIAVYLLYFLFTRRARAWFSEP
jgi:hypothetical protein